MLIDFLPPTGPLMKAVLAADADGLMQFAFPLERLPVRTQRRLQTDPAELNQRLPYRNCVQRDTQGRFHVHLGLYHYFLFWSAYYACSEARGLVSLTNDRRRHGRQGSPYGLGPGRPQWMDGLLGRSQKIHPYRELLLSHLEYFLPRGPASIGRGNSREVGARGTGGWSRPSEPFYRSGNVTQGEMLVSIMIEFGFQELKSPCAPKILRDHRTASARMAALVVSLSARDMGILRDCNSSIRVTIHLTMTSSTLSLC